MLKILPQLVIQWVTSHGEHDNSKVAILNILARAYMRSQSRTNLKEKLQR